MVFCLDIIHLLFFLGTDKESPRSPDMNSNPRGSDLVGEHSESIGDEDEGSSESDEARDLEVNGQSALEASVSMRFCNHLLHLNQLLRSSLFVLAVFCNWRCTWVISLLFDQLRDINPLTFRAILTKSSYPIFPRSLPSVPPIAYRYQLTFLKPNSILLSVDTPSLVAITRTTAQTTNPLLVWVLYLFTIPMLVLVQRSTQTCIQ